MNDYCTTPEERQEVAAKLRENSTAHTADEALQIICKCTIRAAKGSKGVIEVLADLIDPTCKLKIQDGHACCGNCNHILAGEYEAEEDYWCFRPYCPDCGARVVSDD